jgi:hypothetical protein
MWANEHMLVFLPAIMFEQMSEIIHGSKITARTTPTHPKQLDAQGA